LPLKQLVRGSSPRSVTEAPAMGLFDLIVLRRLMSSKQPMAFIEG
jgi:hypothetical protein